MRRVGKYTKKSSVRTAKLETNKYMLWFRNLKRWQKISVIVIPILIVLILIPLATYAYFARDISDKERLMNRNNTGIVLTDKNGEVFYQTGRAKHRELLPLDQISDATKKSLLASEDKDFYNHGGFSVVSLLGAIYGNVVTGGKNFGGSTLTQQLAKNTLLSDQKSFLRKYQEISVSIAIEQTYSKDQILEMYLNSAFFGGNVFGIEDAAKTYFNKAPKDLTLAESAMLIGILPAPNAYSPIYGEMKYAKERQATVLGRMLDNGVITQAEKDQALATELAYAPQVSEADSSPAPHFSQMVLEELNKKYGEEKVARSGFQVKTSLDLGLQKQVQAAIAANMTKIRASGGSNASGIAIDPQTGDIRALVGSYDYNDTTFGKVNMATTSRQPGSSFKPIYYSEALAKGLITPSTILSDTPTNFDGYQPKNALRNYNGDVTVRRALDWSLNIPAVKVMQKLGIDTAVSTAQRMGISTISSDKDYGLSLALGAGEARLVDMSNAYAGLANGGIQKEATYVDSIKSKYNEDVFTAKPSSKQIQTSEGAYLISNILSDNQARAGIFGSSLNVPNKKVAVKTGTTDDSRDAWTIGYTPQLAVGVWVGNNDNTPMSNGGGTLAGPIWRSVMTQAAPAQSGDPFVRPSGIVEKAVCVGTGKLASNAGSNTYKDVFLSSALPEYGCNAKTATPAPTEQKPKQEGESDDETAPTETTPATGTGNNPTTTTPTTPTQTPAPTPTQAPVPTPTPAPAQTPVTTPR